MWSMPTSEAVQTLIKEKYKQQRHNDDENQPLSVPPWGSDGDKRRYFLVQGLDDTTFRVYREGSRYTKNAHWRSVAGSIEEVQALATKLKEVDRSQAARRLAAKIDNAIPMFEATEEVGFTSVRVEPVYWDVLTSSRSAADGSIAKYAVPRSLVQSLDSRCTKAAPAASACGIPTTMTMLSHQMLLPIAGLPGSLLETRHLTPGPLSQQVAAKSVSQELATMARVF